MSHVGLDMVLKVCDLGTGGAVRFGSRSSTCSRLGTLLDDVRVTSAVAVSAAYPVFLPALEQRYRLRDHSGNGFEQMLLLTEGGVYDNLGLSVQEVDRDEHFAPHVYKVDYIVACDAGLGQMAPAAPHVLLSRINRVFRIVHGREQHGERGRLNAVSIAVDSDGSLSGFVYIFLGM